MNDLEINTPTLKDDSTVIGEYLGFSGEDIEGDIRKVLDRFNDAIKISHYGKRATCHKHISEEYRLLEENTYQQAFSLDNKQTAQLREILGTIHMNVLMCDERKSIALYFLGSETWNFTDNWQLIGTAFNATGPVYKEIPALVMLFKHILAALKLDFVCGHSLGAGVAQCFAMAVDCRTLIMLDPQLLTGSQMKLAKRISNNVEFNTPHGIAIVVDFFNPEKSSGGLTTRMKKHRFTHQGILLLKLPLLSSDGDGFVTDKDGSVRQVTMEPKIGKFGYHGSKPDMVLFTNAIERLISV